MTLSVISYGCVVLLCKKETESHELFVARSKKVHINKVKINVAKSKF